MPDELCRLAQLEARMDTMLTDYRRDTDRIIEALDELKSDATRYKGFIGGIVFTVSSVFAVLTWWFSQKG